MIGKALGRISNTFNNLVMGIVTSKPAEKIVGGSARAIGKAVEPAAGAANKVLEGAQAVGKAAMDGNTYRQIGKAVEETAGKVVKGVVTDPEAYKQIGNTHVLAANKSLFGDEMRRRVQGGLDTMAHVARGDSMLTLRQPLVRTGGDNLLPMGASATGLGITLAAASQLAAGTPQAVEQWNRSRQGTNFDSQPVTSAPRVPAYANNGGATGDLVFALNNLRHGGMM